MIGIDRWLGMVIWIASLGVSNTGMGKDGGMVLDSLRLKVEYPGAFLLETLPSISVLLFEFNFGFMIYTYLLDAASVLHRIIVTFHLGHNYYITGSWKINVDFIRFTW
jgi:hypothetical protein